MELKLNKAGLQPISRPVEQILEFFSTGIYIIGQILPDFYVVWTLFAGVGRQGLPFLGSKSKNLNGKNLIL